MYELEGVVGPPESSLGDGTPRTLRLDKQGALISSDVLGKYAEWVSRGAVFHAASQAAVTFAAGLSATAVATLENPTGSGKNLFLLHVGFAFSAAPAAAAVVYLTGNLSTIQAAPTATTPITVRNALLGGATGAGKVYSAATLAAAPIVLEPLVSIVAVGSITPPLVDRDMNGRFIIQPGIYVTLQASAAASGFFSFLWAERPA